MPFKGIDWNKEFPTALEMGKSGKTLVEIGDHYGVTRQRIKQVFERFNVDPKTVGITVRAERKRKERDAAHYTKWGDREQDLYAEKRAKYLAKKANATRIGVEFTVPFSEILFPTHCPILGLELDYFAEGRQENSVSFDRLDTSKGYVTGNVVILSWRANRIKNDGTAEEHRQIADYLDKVKESL